MSTTRRAKETASFSQERWCSAAEFNSGLNAIAVAKRASLLRDQKLIEMIWFIQYRTLQPDGLARLAEAILAEFPDRIGTPAMREIGCITGQNFSADEVRKLRPEIPDMDPDEWRLKGEPSFFEDLCGCRTSDNPTSYPSTYPASDLLSRIEAEKSRLAAHLMRVCLDPGIDLAGSGEQTSTLSENCATANLWWFRDLTGTICEYRQRTMQAACTALAKTEITAAIRGNLDFCLSQGRMILIEGVPGLGKSVSAKAWVEMQGGLARYLEVPAGNDERSFYVKVAAALGVANGTSYNGSQIKVRVEEALQASGLMLVMDEASRLWPQQNRPRGLPARMLWIMSAHDAGTAIALLGFKFSDWRELYTTQTRWPDEQFERRLNREVPLPAAHSKSDLLAIAKSLLPDAETRTLKLLAGVALLHSRKGDSTMVELFETAKYQCEEDGLAEIGFETIKQAIRINHPGFFTEEESPQEGPPQEASPLRSVHRAKRGNISSLPAPSLTL